MADETYHEITKASDVTDEVIGMVRDIADGWYSDGPIDWEDIWDRLERSPRDDWSFFSVGSELDSPAIRKIKKVIRDERRNS